MSLFTDASLVMVPSGIKTSKVYSVVPTDGTGDLDFTRSNDTATRVGPDGLIQKVTRNVLLYSNDFSQWSKLTNGTYTITSENITDPFGNLVSVAKVTLTSGTYLVLRRGAASTLSEISTGSIYVKKTISTTIVNTDLSDVTPTDAANNTEWQRVSSFFNSTSYPYGTFLDVNIQTTNEPVYIAHGQINFGTIATEYLETTTAAVSAGPVANIGRLDYSGGATCSSLKLEGQRTNLVIQSEYFNTYWSLGTISITNNYAISPEGVENASRYISPGGAYPQMAGAVSGLTIGQQYTTTFYVKSDGTSQIEQSFWVNATNELRFTPTSEWTRITHSFIAAATSNTLLLFTNSGSAPASSYLLYGFQMEAGAYPSSYIPTYGAAVTRGADACSKTGISSLIGQTEGTMFVEFKFDYSDSNTQVLYKANQSSDANSVGIEIVGTTIKGLVNSGGANISTITGTIATGTIKAALAYKTNDMAFYVNGTQVGTDTSGSIAFGGVVDILTIGQFLLSGSSYFPASRPFDQALLFTTRLTNAQLAELTTL